MPARFQIEQTLKQENLFDEKDSLPIGRGNWFLRSRLHYLVQVNATMLSENLHNFPVYYLNCYYLCMYTYICMHVYLQKIVSCLDLKELCAQQWRSFKKIYVGQIENNLLQLPQINERKN
jgi:hypothetical protein